MKLNKLNEDIKKLELPEKQKNAILQLIDLKTEQEMEKVLNRFDAMQSEISSIKESMQSEISSIKESMQSEIRSVNDKIMTTNDKIMITNDKIMTTNDKIMTTRYIIGAGLGIIALLITIFKFLG